MIGRGLSALAILALIASPAFAGGHCKVQVQSFALQSGLVVTPFAVPVAAPVAVAQVSPYVYGFSPAGTQSYSAASSSTSEDRIAEKVIAKLKAAGFGGSTFQAQALPAEKPSLVAANCAKCHAGASAAKGYRVDVPLSEAAKLKAIARILEDDAGKRMPKGKTLDPQSLGLLLQELAKSSPLPPVAEPAPAPPEPGKE